MNNKFKKHQKVKILTDPDPEYVEYHTENTDSDSDPIIKKGMVGKVNMILPNGRYHIEILDKDGEPIAYVPMDEESLESAD